MITDTHITHNTYIHGMSVLPMGEWLLVSFISTFFPLCGGESFVCGSLVSVRFVTILTILNDSLTTCGVVSVCAVVWKDNNENQAYTILYDSEIPM
jgi:hypothetical protein